MALRSPRKHVLEDLQDVFGEWVLRSTGQVMNSPSTISGEIACSVASEMDLDRVVKDLGIVAARELADRLESHALRPADYAVLDDIGQIVAKRLVSALRGNFMEVFLKSFQTTLRGRG